MSEQEATHQNATQPLIQERCLCRELCEPVPGSLRCISQCAGTLHQFPDRVPEGIRASSTAASSTCPTPASAAPRSPSSSASDNLEMVCSHWAEATSKSSATSTNPILIGPRSPAVISSKRT